MSWVILLKKIPFINGVKREIKIIKKTIKNVW